MDKILDKDKCTGCTACMNKCPKNAISMELDKDGFYFPIIDKEKCIDCGLCIRTCPVLNSNENKALNKCYAAYSKEEIFSNNSSSGGIFPLIANNILNENGIVIGASLDKNNKLNHIAICKKEELLQLKGSKYLQSNLGNIFKFVKENIENKKILFVGTPCQIAALKFYLKKDYDNLLTIDLFCHGVPSPKLFEKYIDYLQNKFNEKVKSYNFRDKKTGWDSYSNTIKLETKVISEDRKDNYYMKLFLSDNALRESCYNCNFKLGNKYSDITLGDFWGIKNKYPEMYNKNGVSAIIINTQKGINTFKEIESYLSFKECSINDIIDGNKSLINSAKLTPKREKLFRELDTLDFKKLTNKYKKKTSILNKVKTKIKGILRGK